MPTAKKKNAKLIPKARVIATRQKRGAVSAVVKKVLKTPPKSTGRPKGAANKKLDDEQREVFAEQLTHLTPMQFALNVLRDPNAFIVDRQWACALLMPYMHRKMPIAVDGGADRPIQVVTSDVLKNLSDKQIDDYLQLMTMMGVKIRGEDIESTAIDVTEFENG